MSLMSFLPFEWGAGRKGRGDGVADVSSALHQTHLYSENTAIVGHPRARSMTTRTRLAVTGSNRSSFLWPIVRSVNVFTPKWTNMVNSPRCQSSCTGDGTGGRGAGAETEGTVENLYVVLLLNTSPGRRVVVGNCGLLGESG